VLDTNAAANILPRALKISLDDAADPPVGAKDSPAWLRLILVPDTPGVVRFQDGATNDQPWQPDAPFYMAATETSFGQMRLYARWAEQELARHPEQEKWFMRVPATKQLVGAQNRPYTGVTLDEALSFCNWLSFAHGREPAYTRSRDANWKQDRTKDGFRLADDSEWQFAARFGFDFLAGSGTPRWKDLWQEFNRYSLDGTNDLRLVYFFMDQAGANPRAVDAPGALLYPLGLRDLCGNAAELCLAETSTSEMLDWTACGGQYSFRSPRGVMPWSRKKFPGISNADVGFRVVLPVPMDNF
jgi:formylglycine-generating enzyme required for sulfatase activity